MKASNLKPETLKWILIILFVGWLFYVAGLYFVTQKPIFPTDVSLILASFRQPTAFSATALARTTLDILAALWLWAIALGIGGWLWQWLAPRNLTTKKQRHGEKNSPQIHTDERGYSFFFRNLLSKSAKICVHLWTNQPEQLSAERLIFSAGLGIGALGLLAFGLGLVGWLTRPVILGVLGVLSVAALPQLRMTSGQLRIAIRRSLFVTRYSSLVTFFLSVTILLAFTIALLPPIDWDGLFYHLTAPKSYLAAGRIVGGVDIPHFSFPQLLEMVFALAIAVRGDVTAKLMHFGFVFLLGGLVWLTARKVLRVKNSWLALLFLFSVPMVLTLASWAYNDLALAFFELAAVYFLVYSFQFSVFSRRALVLSGIFSGLAMGLKYTSAVAIGTVGALLLWQLWRNRISLASSIRAVATFALPALAVASPWYLKNWLFTGNPVYPFLFGGVFWDDFRTAAYSGAGSGIGWNWATLTSLPVQLTLGIHDANFIDGRTGLLFLAFLPLLLTYGMFRYRRKSHPPALSILLIFALAQFSFWTLGVIWSAGLWQSRLLLPMFVTLSPVLAWLVDDVAHLDHPQFSLRRFLLLFIAVTLTLGFVDQLFTNVGHNRTGWIYYRPDRHLIGTENRADYLSRRLGAHFHAMETLNAKLPADAVVQFLWEPRAYFCNLDCRPDSILDTYGHWQYLYGKDAAAINTALRRDDVTHVLVFSAGLNFLLNDPSVPSKNRPDVTVLNRLKSDYWDELFSVDGAYTVFVIRDS